MIKKYKILHIEDSLSDSDIIQRILKTSDLEFQYCLADNEQNVRLALEEFNPDIVLCDHSLPSFNSKIAYNLCKEKYPELVFILVTGTVSEEFAVETLRSGVDDYLLKTNLKRLPVAIENAYTKRQNDKKVQDFKSELIKSETHLRTIFENSPVGLLLVDCNGIIIELNDRTKYYNKISFGRELVKNENLLESVPGYRREELKTKFEKTLQGNKIQYESVYPQQDGTIIIFDVKLSPAINGDGAITGVCMTIEDITERKEVNEEMKRLTNRLMLATNSAGMGIWEWDIKTDHLLWDEGMYRLYNIDSKHFGSIYNEWLSRLHPDDSERVNEDIQLAVTGNSKYDTVFRIIWDDQSVHHIRATGIIESDDTGNTVRMIGLNWDITNIKLSEQAFIKSESRYRQIVETAQEGILTTDENQIITFANRKFAEIVGFELQELIGKPIFDLMDEEGVRNGKLNLERRKNGISETIELIFISKTGKNIWANTAVTPNFSEDKKFKGTLAMISDITERKIAEERIRKSEADLKEAQHVAKCGNWNMDLISNKLTWSEELYTIFDVDKTTFTEIYTSFINLVDTKDRERIRSITQQARITGEPFVLEYQITSRGEKRIIQDIGKAELDANGKVIRLYGTAQDITERKEAEQEFIKSESRYRRIVETAQEGIFKIDVQSKIYLANKKFAEIVEYDLDELLGKVVFDLMDEEEIVSFNLNIEKIKTGINHNIELKLKSKNGRNIWASISATPLFTEDKKFMGILGMISDITDRKILADRIRKSEAELKEAQHVAKYGNWNFNIITDELTWSDELYNVFGTDKEVFNQTHNSFLHLVDAEDREFALQTSLHTQKTGEPFNINYHITTPEGEKRIINELGYAECDPTGKVLRLYGTAQDITERKRAEKELLELNEQFRKLTAHIQTIREEERTSIAREVHDELGQQMTSLKMDIAWLNNKTKDKRPEVKERINGMLEMTNEAIRTIRRIVIQLRPGILDDLGLVAALEWQAKEFEKRNGIACKFSPSVKNETFSKEVNTAIFRIFQESLTNVTRHAQATEVNAHLYEENKSLVLEVSDNGIGISDDRKNNKISFGLLGMKERAAILQGSFDIRKLNGRGTVVQLKIPI